MPPPMALAIGQEIKKCLVWKMEREKSETEQSSMDAANLLDR